ncbi:hypothetical protein DFJ74DRAFT_649879 [Hyaloraphidium curvatum]|nr:hypothetical protein DFJ74DRAFT_649879 [Hyaloraphidium curvatum]
MAQSHVKGLSSKLSQMKFMQRGSRPADSGSSSEPSRASKEDQPIPQAPRRGPESLAPAKDAPSAGKEAVEAEGQPKLVVEVESSYLGFLPFSPVGRISYGAKKKDDTGAGGAAKDGQDAAVSDADMARTLASPGAKNGLPSAFGKRRREGEGDEGDRGSKTSVGLQAKDGGVEKRQKKAPWSSKPSSGGRRFFDRVSDP